MTLKKIILVSLLFPEIHFSIVKKQISYTQCSADSRGFSWDISKDPSFKRKGVYSLCLHFCVAFVLFWWWCGLGFACLFVWGSSFVSLVFLLVTNISISVKFLWESPKFGNSKICPFLKILATVSMTGCSLPSVL